jgi:hypothetical protein
MEKQQYLPFVTCLPISSSQQYNHLNVAMDKQERFPLTVSSSGKLFGSAVNNISIAKSSWEVTCFFVRFEPNLEILDRFL